MFEKAVRAGSLPDKKAIRSALALVGQKNIQVRGRQVSLKKKGMAITLDGIAKGYIVDQGVNFLAENGFSDIYLEAGGDLMVKGQKKGGVPWKIGIRNPRPEKPAKLIAAAVHNSAVATSGDYLQYYSPDLRYHHIVNPLTGISPAELASATVMAPTVAMADALATGTMVMGAVKSLSLLNKLPDCEGLFIDKKQVTHRTEGFFS